MVNNVFPYRTPICACDSVRPHPLASTYYVEYVPRNRCSHNPHNVGIPLLKRFVLHGRNLCSTETKTLGMLVDYCSFCRICNPNNHLPLVPSPSTVLSALKPNMRDKLYDGFILHKSLQVILRATMKRLESFRINPTLMHGGLAR